MLQLFPVHLDYWHLGGGAAWKVSHVPGEPLAQEYRSGVSFKICLLCFVISDHILIVSF